MATVLDQVDDEFTDIYRHTEVRRIVFDARGNQLRQALSGTKTHETWSFPSKRWRRAVTGETALELVIAKRFEAEAGVLDFNPQPCRIEGEVRGRPTMALPDFAAVEIGCVPVLGEAKRNWAQFDRTAALRQKALTMKGAERLGWNYRQVTADSIGTLAYRENLDEVTAHRFAHVPVRQEQAAIAALAQNGAMPIADLCDEMKETVPRGQALVCALMVCRLVEIDLRTPIDARSIVRRAPVLPFAFPRIRL
jgi:hypothetical protein